MDQLVLKKHPEHDILVSSCGTVVENAQTGFRYSFHETEKGYLRLEFRYKKNGITRVFKKFVHTLVAETYLKRKPGCKEVDHKDRVRKNNHYTNLRWATRKQQVRNSAAYKHGKYAKKSRCKKWKLNY